MKFPEYFAGQTIVLGPVVMTQADIIKFATDWDPQWFHTDPERAANSRWNGLIASGWHTVSTAMRLVVDGPLKESGSIGSPGLAYLKWLAPVRPNDAISVHVEVLETGVSKTGRMGSVRWRWLVKNQNEVTVLDTEATSLFELIPPSA